MPFFTAPTSFRRATQVLSLLTRDLGPDATIASPDSSQIYFSSTSSTRSEGEAARLLAHSSHPNFGHLTLLVLEAVLEVVCVSLPGYILARRGLFNPEMQKFAANLNVLLFTPCLSKVPSSRAMV
jgi:choline kinase